ncbi:MAG: methionyl-tRNA formyltransferase [Aureispira sp.]
MKIVFMGTAEFAVPTLELLLEEGYNIVGVITATDKWGGRGNKKLLQSAVKKFAVEKGLNILQPKNLKAASFQEELRALEADLQVVVAFRMLPESVWNMPPQGTMNIHGSLLPKYRGAAPIHWAVINGETETGVSSFQLKHEIDTGDILFQSSTPIGENETTGDVYERLMHLGAQLALKSVRAVEAGTAQSTPQVDAAMSHAPKVFHDGCKINFDQRTAQVHNFIRGMSPVPTAWTLLDGTKLKIFRSQKELVTHEYPVGSIHSDGKRYLKIATQDGFVQLLDVQLTKRKRMDVKSFLNGYQIDNNQVE